MAAIRDSRMALTKFDSAAVKSCAKDYIPRSQNCGVWDGKVGAGFVPAPPSSALAGRKPNSPISGNTVMRKAIRDTTEDQWLIPTRVLQSRQMEPDLPCSTSTRSVCMKSLKDRKAAR